MVFLEFYNEELIPVYSRIITLIKTFVKFLSENFRKEKYIIVYTIDGFSKLFFII